MPTPIGRGAEFVPPVRPPEKGCTAGSPLGRFRAHLELFGRRHAVVIPAGIGLGPPLRHSHSSRITGAACRADTRTLDPAGVIDFDRTDLTLGDLFEIWGEPLGPRRMASFRGPVTAYVAGHRVEGDPAAIELRDGAQIVLEVGGHIPPHRTFLFPPAAASVGFVEAYGVPPEHAQVFIHEVDRGILEDESSGSRPIPPRQCLQSMPSHAARAPRPVSNSNLIGGRLR